MKVDFYHYNFHETINWENIYKALVELGVDAQFIVEAPDTNTSRTLSWDGYKRITSYMRLRNYPYLPRPRYEDADAAVTTQETKWLQHYKGLKINSLYGSTLTKDAAGYRKAKLAGFDGILAHGWYSKHRIITNGIPEGKIAIMGFPKYVDYFRGNVDRRECQKIFNLNPAKKTIVYIPSWHRNSSIDVFLDTISGLSGEFNILIKPHHNNIEREQNRITKMQHLKDIFLQDFPCSSVPFYVVGDIVIADTRSGAFPEGVLTNSRLIGLHVRNNTQADFVEPFVYQLAPICKTPGQLLEAINEFTSSEIDKYQPAKKFIKPYLFTDFQGNDDLEAAKAIIKFIEQNKNTTANIRAISTSEHLAGQVSKQTVTKTADKQASRAVSELDNTVPPEIKNDEFYFLIQKLAQQENIKTILEIGSSSGTGSTEAFVKGLHKNPNKPTLFCMEISAPRFAELQNRYAADPNVKCYNISSIPLDKFPTEQEVSSFYYNIKTTLNNYPIERVLGWLRQDIEYMKSSGHCENGIQIIKDENNIKNFDMVLIDGSAFTGTAEFNEIYGARLILLDDINSIKNYDNYKRLIKDPNYSLVAENRRLRNGYAAFKKMIIPPNSYASIKSAVESVEGLLCPGQEEFLFNKVKSLPEDAVIVEIGSGKGRSTVAMGYACMGTNRKIYCIDTWQGHNFDSSECGFFDTWQKNIQKNGLNQYVTPLRGYSNETLARWDELTREKKIDFAFIDGSHEYQEVLKDFEMCYSRLKEGGWIAFHDIVKTWPGPERLWNEKAKFILTNHEYCSSIACGQKNSNLNNDKTMEHIDELDNITSPIVKNAELHTQLSKKLRLMLVYSLHPVTPRITLPEWIKEALRKYYASDVEVFACGPENEINIPDSSDFYDRVAKEVKDLDIDAIWDIEGGAASKDFMFKRFPRQISIPKLWWAIDTHQYLPLMVEKAKFFDVVFSAQKNAVATLGPRALWLPAGASIHEVDHQLKRTIDVGFIGNVSPKVHQRRKKILERLRNKIYGFRCFKSVFLQEKAELASQMKIMVNISLKNDINFRVFETLACGAMLITDKIYNNGFDELFEDGKHLVTFETEEELIDKIHYYLKHESQREHIARAGQQRVLQQFTHRVLLKKPLNIITKLVEQHRQKTQQAVPIPIRKTVRCWCNGQLKESVHPLYGQCQDCGTLVLKKQLTKEQLKEFYAFDRYWHNEQVNVSGHPPIEQRATDDFGNRIPVWYQIMRKFKPEVQNLLEIGCAHGGFLHYCRERGVENVVGVEPDEKTCEFARKHFNLPYIVSGLFPDVSLPFEKFDGVTGFDIIEHFLDPLRAMRKVADLLNDDGIYFFQIPCYRDQGREWVQFRPNEHIFLYNPASIQQLFHRAGLGVMEILSGYFPDDIFIIGCKKEGNTGALLIPEEKKQDSRTNRWNLKIAEDYVEGKDGTKIETESDFSRSIQRLFEKIRPKKIIETGTYLGTGTTTIIAETLRGLGLENQSMFYTIEVNPEYYSRAKEHLSANSFNITALNGLSIPRSVLPNMEQIRKSTVTNVKFDDIFIDHKPDVRAELYYRETNFENVPDNLLYLCLKSFNFKPDFVLLDSAGHMGHIEFKYLIEHLKGDCYIALDDIYHIKHHESFRKIQSDPRFKVIKCSNEKFGFCIAKFTPQQEVVEQKVKNILWVRTDSIGDNVLAASMLPHIQEKYKDAKITVVCQEHIAELYETCPYVDNIIVFNRKRALEDGQYRQEIIDRLRAPKPDLSLNSVFSREPLTDVFAIECGARQRVALEGNLSNISAEFRDKNNRFYTQLLASEGEHKLELERHRDFLRGLCIDVPSLKPIVWIASEDEKFADSFFRENSLNPDQTIALFAGVQYEVRLYEKYGKSLSEFCKENQFNVIALGSKCEHGINQRNLDEIGVRTVNLSGKTTIRQSAAILKRCRLAVGAETGLAHISCTVGTPNVILLGGGHFGRFMPYSPLTSIVCLPLQCYGCNWRCSNQRVHCVKDIRPEVITEAIRQSLAGPSKKPRVFVQDTSPWKPKPGQPQWKPFEDFLNINAVEVIPVGQTVLGIEQTSQGRVKSSESEYLVTAIISTYNSERFIRGCLEDLEKQTIADKLEIIVVNSGSQENEDAIIRKFQQKYDNINYIKTEQREGLYKAWNRAINAASGRYITNANTDDRHRKDAFEVLSHALEEHPDISLVYADCYVSSIQNGDSKRYIYRYPDFFPVAAALHYQFGPQPMWRKKVHETIGYFDESYRAIGDYDFNLRFALHLKALHIAEPLGLYLEHPAAVTFRDDTRLQEHKRIAFTYRSAEIIERLYKQVGIACDTPQERAQVHLDIGIRALEYYPPWRMGEPERNLKFALQCFQRAAKWKPGLAAAYNNFAIVLALIGNFQNAAKVLGRISRLIQDPIIDYNFKLISELLSSGRVRSDAKLIPSGLALPSQSQISLEQKSPNALRHYARLFVD